ncbi:MAG: hypothetical protein KGH63_00920 [Candidatus Micrarchaeota archaeon]|nr:hypothetical protein [Candidatus Micrarchaeota archaeon]
MVPPIRPISPISDATGSNRDRSNPQFSRGPANGKGPMFEPLSVNMRPLSEDKLDDSGRAKAADFAKRILVPSFVPNLNKLVDIGNQYLREARNGAPKEALSAMAKDFNAIAMVLKAEILNYSRWAENVYPDPSPERSVMRGVSHHVNNYTFPPVMYLEFMARSGPTPEILETVSDSLQRLAWVAARLEGASKDPAEIEPLIFLSHFDVKA